VYDNVAIALEVLGSPRASSARASARRSSASASRAAAATRRRALRRRAAARRDRPSDRGRAGARARGRAHGNLDPQLAIDILGLFEDIHETGTTVLFATHDRTLLDVRPRRIVILDEGKATDVPESRDEDVDDDDDDLVDEDWSDLDTEAA
jgi:cell division transport system ATP-binding protein